MREEEQMKLKKEKRILEQRIKNQHGKEMHNETQRLNSEIES